MTISNPATDAIGQSTATLKVDGDNSVSDIYFAIRTTGAYGDGDGADIRAGNGAVFAKSMPNISRQYCLATGLEPSTQYYWGATTASPGDLFARSVNSRSSIRSAPILGDDEVLLSINPVFGPATAQEATVEERSSAIWSAATITAAIAAMVWLDIPVDSTMTLAMAIGVMAIGESVVIGGSFTTKASPLEELSDIIHPGVLRL